LFSSSASSERKFWGFLLFQKILKEAAQYPVLLDPLFSQNLMRCLINHVSKEDRFLHRAAEKSLKTIQQIVEAKPDLASVIIKKLLTGSGVYNFDHVTKTKTIEKLLYPVHGDAAFLVISELLSAIKVVKT
jgi:DNA polymerase phi